MQKLILIFLTSLFINNVMAGPYIAAEAGYMRLNTESSAYDKMDAHGFGAYLGYKLLGLAAAEAFFKAYDFGDQNAKVLNTTLKTELDSIIVGAGARVFFSFLSAKAGLAAHKFNVAAKVVECQSVSAGVVDS